MKSKWYGTQSTGIISCLLVEQRANIKCVKCWCSVIKPVENKTGVCDLDTMNWNFKNLSRLVTDQTTTQKFLKISSFVIIAKKIKTSYYYVEASTIFNCFSHRLPHMITSIKGHSSYSCLMFWNATISKHLNRTEIWSFFTYHDDLGNFELLCYIGHN